MIRSVALWGILASIAGIIAAQPAAAELTPSRAAAFDRYVAIVEGQVRKEQSAPASFLAIQSFSPAQRTEAWTRLRKGEVLIEKRNQGSTEVPGGLIHHWRGTAFIPNASVRQVLALVKDYDHMAQYYQPEVMNSRLLSQRGDDFHISMRLRKHKVVTVVLDTEYDVHYGQIDSGHHFSISRSTRVGEVVNPGKRDEQVLDTQHDHGFMWRLNSYWRFVQEADGVTIQCEAVSLTRDVPTGLGWMIGPFVQNIPRESLQFTLMATRNAVLANVTQLRAAGR